MASQDIIKAVAKELKYYMEVKRRENEFDSNIAKLGSLAPDTTKPTKSDDLTWNPNGTYSVEKPGGSGRDSTSPVSLLKMIAPAKLTRGEAERLISTASKLIVATETILLPQQSRSKSEPRNSTRFPHLDKKDLSASRQDPTDKNSNVRRCVVFDKNGRRMTIKKNIDRIDNSFDSTYDGHPRSVTSPTEVYDSRSTHVPEWLRHEMSKVPFGSEETNKLIINDENPAEARLRKRPMTAHVWSINARLRRRARLLGDSWSTAATIASEEDNGPRILKEDIGIQTETCLFPIVMNGPRTRYKIEVHTGDKLGAGTRAKIFITIRGDRGRCEQLNLDSSLTHQVKFKRGQTDVFDFELPYLGQLESITIGHRKKDIRYSWHLDSVHITDCNSNIVYIFPCHQWLSAEMGPKQTLRDLSVAEIKELPSDSDSEGPGDSSETECLYAADEESARQSVELPDDGLPPLSTTPSLIANCSITPDEDDRISERSGTEHYPESMIHEGKTEMKKNLNSLTSNSNTGATIIPPLISNYFHLPQTKSAELFANSERKEIEFEQTNIHSPHLSGEHLEDNEDKIFRVHSVEKIKLKNNEEKEPNDITKINQRLIEPRQYDQLSEVYIKDETKIDTNIHIPEESIKFDNEISDEETTARELVVKHEESVKKNSQRKNGDENSNHGQERIEAIIKETIVDEEVPERTPSDEIAIKEMSNNEALAVELPDELERTEEILEDELLTEIQFEEAVDELTDTETLDNVEIVSEETHYDRETAEEILTESCVNDEIPINRKATKDSRVEEIAAEEITNKGRTSDEEIAYEGSIISVQIIVESSAVDKTTVEEVLLTCNEIKTERIATQETSEEAAIDEKITVESEEETVITEDTEEETVKENLSGEAADGENTIGETTDEETTFGIVIGQETNTDLIGIAKQNKLASAADKEVPVEQSVAEETEVEIESGEIQPKEIPHDAVIDIIANEESTKNLSVERLPTEQISNEIKLVEDIAVEREDSIKEECIEIPIVGVISVQEETFKDVLVKKEVKQIFIDGDVITKEISVQKVAQEETPVEKDFTEEMSVDGVNTRKMLDETVAEEILNDTEIDKVNTIESMDDELYVETVVDKANSGELEASEEMPVESIITKEMGIEKGEIKEIEINYKSDEEILFEDTPTEEIPDNKLMNNETEDENAGNLEITNDEAAIWVAEADNAMVYDQSTNEMVTQETLANTAYDTQNDGVTPNGKSDNQEIQSHETQAHKNINMEYPDEVDTEEIPIKGMIFEELSVKSDDSKEILQKVFVEEDLNAENEETSTKGESLLNESEKLNILELTGSQEILPEGAEDKQIVIEEKVIEEPSHEKVQDRENQVIKEYLDNGHQDKDLTTEKLKIITGLLNEESQGMEDVLDKKYEIAAEILLEESQCETEVKALNEVPYIAKENLKFQDAEEDLSRDDQIAVEKIIIEDTNIEKINNNKSLIIDRERVEAIYVCDEPIAVKNLNVGQMGSEELPFNFEAIKPIGENIMERDAISEKESQYYEKAILNEEKTPKSGPTDEETSNTDILAEEDYEKIVTEGMLHEAENRVANNERIQNEDGNTSLDNLIPIKESNAIEAGETSKEYKEAIDEKDQHEADEQNSVPIVIEKQENGIIVSKECETVSGLDTNGKDFSPIKLKRENTSNENSTKITGTSVENSSDYNFNDNTPINKEQITTAQEQNKPIEQMLETGNLNQDDLQHTSQSLAVNPLHNNDHYHSSVSEGLNNSQTDIRKLLEGRRHMLEDLECDDDYWENMANKDGETQLNRETIGQRSDTVSLSHSGIGESDEEFLHDQEKLNQRKQQLQYSLERMLNFSFEDGDEEYGIRKDSASGSESYRTRKGPHSLTDLSEDSEDIRPQTVLVNGQLMDELEVYPSKDQEVNQFLKNAPDSASWHGSLDSEDHDVIFKPTSAKDKGIMVKAEVHRRNSDLSREKENSPLDDEHPLLKNGPTIHEAADKGDLNRVQALVAHYPLFKDIPDEKGWTPLHHAVAQDQFNVLQVLIEMGASLNSQSNSNETPLHIAVMSGHAELARQLIVNGADVEILDSSNRLPLDVAFELKDSNMIKIFKDTRLNPKPPSLNDNAETSSHNGMFATSQALVVDANLPTEGNSEILCG